MALCAEVVGADAMVSQVENAAAISVVVCLHQPVNEAVAGGLFALLKKMGLS